MGCTGAGLAASRHRTVHSTLLLKASERILPERASTRPWYLNVCGFHWVLLCPTVVYPSCEASGRFASGRNKTETICAVELYLGMWCFHNVGILSFLVFLGLVNPCVSNLLRLCGLKSTPSCFTEVTNSFATVCLLMHIVWDINGRCFLAINSFLENVRYNTWVMLLITAYKFDDKQ